MSAKCLFLIAVLQITVSAALADQTAIYGQWGNEKQCLRRLILSDGSMHAAPFDIQRGWINHGDIWCRLSWISSKSSSAGVLAFAHGLCGEDDLREYRIRFELHEDQLTVHWNQQIANGPLRRCAVFIEG